jgi:pimeloyl-ACP methyl ester carboxylesterase
VARHGRPHPTWLVALSLLGAALAVLAAMAVPPTARSGVAGGGELTGRVDIGGRSLYVECRGKGSPTVVLDAGLRSRGDFWSVPLDPAANPATVLDGVSRFTRVCEYDRPGTTLGAELSRSDPVPMPRTARQASDDLRALLRVAEVPGSYATGGLFVQLYARRFPRRVGGLVLVDSLAERLESAFTPPEWALFKKLNTDPPPGLEGYRDLEVIDFDTSYAQLRRAQRRRPLPAMPLTVISRTVPSELPQDVPPGYPETFEEVWQRGQDALADLLPHTRHVHAKRSGHYVMLDRPKLAIREIRRVVEAARKRD